MRVAPGTFGVVDGDDGPSWQGHPLLASAVVEPDRAALLLDPDVALPAMTEGGPPQDRRPRRLPGPVHNLFIVDAAGRRVWCPSLPTPLQPTDWWVAIGVRDGVLHAHSWSCWRVTLDVGRQALVDQAFTK